jgi:hypothetical protein
VVDGLVERMREVSVVERMREVSVVERRKTEKRSV